MRSTNKSDVKEWVLISDEIMPNKDVVRAIRESLALIGNASSYITMNRRPIIVDEVKEARPQLSSFFK